MTDKNTALFEFKIKLLTAHSPVLCKHEVGIGVGKCKATLFKLYDRVIPGFYNILAMIEIIIIAFNIFGSLTMLIIEKEDDIRILRSMGATRKLISRVFVLEGWMISLAGLAAGTVIGTALSLIQQQFGIIKMPGHYVVQAYPILLSWADIAITAAGVAIIGYLIAVLPVMTRSRRWEE